MEGPCWHCHAPGHSHKGCIQETFPACPGAEWEGQGSSSTATHPSAAAAQVSPSLAALGPWGQWHLQWDFATLRGSLVTFTHLHPGLWEKDTKAQMTTSTLCARVGVLSTLGAPAGSAGT